MSKVNFSDYSTQQLRDFLMGEGWQEEELQTSKVNLVKMIKSNNLEDKFAEEPVTFFDENEIEMDDDSVTPKDILLNELQERKKVGPRRGEPEWNEYVLSKFTPDEYVDVKVDDGTKTIRGVKCDGLRRVAELVLGQIVESGAVDSGLNYPDYTINKSSDQVKLKNPPFAWVRYRVVFMDDFGKTTVWGGCADVNSNNTDAKFLPFAFATAETRAEARALRKALGIKILAAEELTTIDTAATVQSITNADWADGPIEDVQKVMINRLCSKTKISPYKVINCLTKVGEDKEKITLWFDSKQIRNHSVDDLTKSQASGVCKILGELQRGEKITDPSLLEEQK